MKKQLISLMTCILVFAMVLVSCGDTSPQTGSRTETSEATSTAPVMPTEEKEEVPDIPDVSQLDFKGQELNILVWKTAGRNEVTDNDDFFDDADKETMEGQLIYEAALERERAVEEKYDITINTEVTSDKVADKYLNAYKSGDMNWDIIAPMMHDVPNLLINETLMELGSLDYLDITKTYWDQGVFEGLSIGGKNYMLTGDISTMDEELDVCIAYNMTLGEECGIDPVSYVKEGKWTIDVFGELARQVTKDLDGGGVMDKNDQYGLVHNHSSATDFPQCSGERFAVLDADGKPRITINTPRVVEVLEKVHALYNDPTVAATITAGPTKIFASWAELHETMNSGRAAFTPTNIYRLRTFLLMEDEFTVLPMPKLDDAQTKYQHRLSTHNLPVYCVPISSDRTQFISIMLEELAYYGRKIITPAYYESYIGGRLTQDQTTADMFDIIFDTVIYDIGYVFNWGDMTSAVTKSIVEGNPASKIDSIMSAANTAMNETYEAIINAIN